MIDRVAALADIVAPRPVAPPSGIAAWSAPAAWWLGAALLLLAGLVLAWAARRLRRALARRRLRRLAARLRDHPDAVELERVLPGVWADLRRAGFERHTLQQATRAQRERLLYARRPPVDVLRALLEALPS